MRVLYVCHRIPYPPNKGEKIRAFHQLRAMAERHEVDLFTLVDDPADLKHASALKEYCHDVTVAPLNRVWSQIRALPVLLTRRPISVPYFYSAELDSMLRKAILRRSYDRIFVYCSMMSQYVDWVEDIPMLLDMVDVDSDKWLQYASFTRGPMKAVYRREANTLREYERGVCGKFRYVFVTTEREAQLVREISPGARVHVIRNGVDAGYFSPPPQLPESPFPTLVFTGDMGYFANEQAVTYFAQSVLPLIRQSIPTVKLLIVGRRPSRKVQELKSLEGVEVTGFVPDVRPYLAQAQVSVAPFSIATGIQNKILEAMAFGLPIAGTSRAVQGLSPNVRGLVHVGDTAEALAAQVVELLRNPDLARRTGLEGRRRIATDYDWGQALDELLQLLQNPAITPAATAVSYSPIC